MAGLHRQHHYDLIILDLVMPAMSGYAVMDALRPLERDGYLPVMVIAADPEARLEALEAGATSVLLDNFELPAMREAVTLNAGRALLEASGGVNMESVRAIAETGVDRISIGSLTKDVKATDYSLRIID